LGSWGVKGVDFVIAVLFEKKIKKSRDMSESVKFTPQLPSIRGVSSRKIKKQKVLKIE